MAAMAAALQGRPVTDKELAEFLERFRRYAKPSNFPTKSEMDECVKMGEALKWMLENEIAEFCGKTRHFQPISCQYQDDGTRHTTRIRRTLGKGDSRTHREGAQVREFLAQRIIVSVSPKLRGPHMRALLKEPKTFENGGTAWHTFGARINFMEPMWNLGHRGIAHYHYEFDRKLFAKASRLAAKWHDLRIIEDVPEAQRRNVWLRTWITEEPCPIHDTHNFLTWGMFFY